MIPKGDTPRGHGGGSGISWLVNTGEFGRFGELGALKLRNARWLGIYWLVNTGEFGRFGELGALELRNARWLGIYWLVNTGICWLVNKGEFVEGAKGKVSTFPFALASLLKEKPRCATYYAASAFIL